MGNNTESITFSATPTTSTTPISTPLTPIPASVPIRSGPGGTTANGTQACAACKYQRRKCAADCPLAKHFPAHEQKNFLHVHKLFGVSNIVKVLKAVKPFEQEQAVRSLVFHANARAADPVGGVLRMVGDLERQIAVHKAELEFVLRQLAVCRASAAARDLGNFSTPKYNFGGGGGGGGGESTLGLCATAVQDLDAMLYFNQDCYMGLDLLRENAGGGFGGVRVGVSGGRSSSVVDDPIDVKPLVQLHPINLNSNSRGKVGAKKLGIINSGNEQWEQENEDVNVRSGVSSISI